ncbi:MAG: helix-turn-helix domain-containing protein [Pyrinomonadaceae bacterium]
MGKFSRPKPTLLPEKLRQIRLALGLSQNEMIKKLGLTDQLLQGSISGYEIGTREPPLPVLLKYAQTAGICTDFLIDDGLRLPAKLPSIAQHNLRRSR